MCGYLHGILYVLAVCQLMVVMSSVSVFIAMFLFLHAQNFLSFVQLSNWHVGGVLIFL